MPTDATAWLRSRAHANHRLGSGSEPVDAAARAANQAAAGRRGAAPRGYYAGPIRRAVGSAPDGIGMDRRADSGFVSWYVPEGAEFDAEMARGYNSGPTNNPASQTWSVDPGSRVDPGDFRYETEDDHPDEQEDWDLSPMGRTIRAGGWVDHDWGRFNEHGWVPSSESELRAHQEILEAAADAMLDAAGAPNPGPAAPSPTRPRKARKKASPRRVDPRTAGLPTSEDGSIDADAWEAYWTA